MSERYANTVVVESPAAEAGGAAGANLPRIALLYTEDKLLAHVEQTLAALRVPVVYRSAIAQADAAALTGAHPEIALINLDERCGEELDTLTAALDAAGVPIVFNDADISNGLEGWARARWARHLCAKLCGKDDVDPPRPMQQAPVAPPTMDAVAATPAAEVVAEIPVPVAPIVQPEPQPVIEPASASRPLSQGEIDSLVADFPSEATVAGADTEALSAHIDALLANAADSASREPAPWEVVGFADEGEESTPAPAPVAAKPGAPAVAAAKPAAPSSIDQWQLVDDFTPVAPVAKPVAPPPSTNFGGLSLELEPLDPTESGQ